MSGRIFFKFCGFLRIYELSIKIEMRHEKEFQLTVSSIYLADRAKQIKTKATVNEDPTDKLIRELREQNEKLKVS